MLILSADIMTVLGTDKASLINVAQVLIGAGILAGVVKLIYNSGKIVNKVETLTKTIDNDIKPDIRTIKAEVNDGTKDIADIKGKVQILWQDRTSAANSPRALNAKGMDILENSGVKPIVEERTEELTEAVRAQNPTNAYKAEQAVLEVVDNLKNDSAIKDTIQNGAYKVGSTVDEVLFVGAIYIRDRILDELKMNVADIDQHQPNN